MEKIYIRGLCLDGCGSWLIGKRHVSVSDILLVCVWEKAVIDDSEHIRAQELQCKTMAENAQKDLEQALPALEEAMKVDLSPAQCYNPACPSEHW